MTSNGITVGLNEGSRSSSRVLKPPGGGHTDIFGGKDAQHTQVRRDHGRNASSILEGTNTELPQTQAASSSDKISSSVPPPEKKNDPPTSQTRARVPPGGFSSGLW